MFASGNISPQSMRMIVRSGSSAAPCSIAMQLRPISPSPPRKTMRTGTDGSVAPGARRSATGGDQAFVDAASGVFESMGRRPHRGPAFPDVMTERSQHRLRRYRVRGVVAGLELVALQLAGVDPAAQRRCRSRSQASNISTWSGAHQCVATPIAPTAPTASSGSVIESSPRVDLEVVGARSPSPRRSPRGSPRRP